MTSSIQDILHRSRTVAVVGISRDRAKPAGGVPAALQARGFDIIPVNPKGEEILGKKSLASLNDVADPIDIVEVFRPSAEAPDIARAAVAIGAKALWLQQGIRSDEARKIAEEGGLDYVESRCMGVETELHGITKTPQH